MSTPQSRPPAKIDTAPELELARTCSPLLERKYLFQRQGRWSQYIGSHSGLATCGSICHLHAPRTCGNKFGSVKYIGLRVDAALASCSRLHPETWTESPQPHNNRTRPKSKLRVKGLQRKARMLDIIHREAPHDGTLRPPCKHLSTQPRGW